VQQRHYPPHAAHYHQADDACEGYLLAFFYLCGIASAEYPCLGDAPNKDHEREAEEKREQEADEAEGDIYETGKVFWGLWHTLEKLDGAGEHGQQGLGAKDNHAADNCPEERVARFFERVRLALRGNKEKARVHNEKDDNRNREYDDDLEDEFQEVCNGINFERVLELGR